MRRYAAIPLVVGLLLLLTMMPADAAERTAVFQSNVTVPIYGTPGLGTLTVVYDDATGEGTWDFQGSIGGTAAFSSGQGTLVVESSAMSETVAQLTMTSIDTWQMPGLAPHVPRSATVRTVGELAYVDYSGRKFDVVGVPVAVSPELTFPVEGVYTITDAASGEQPIKVLPGTGVGPAATSTGQLNFPMLGGLVGVLLLAGIAIVGGRRHLLLRAEPHG